MSRVLSSRLARIELRLVGSADDRLRRLSDDDLDVCIEFLKRRLQEEEGETVPPHRDDERAWRLWEPVRATR